MKFGVAAAQKSRQQHFVWSTAGEENNKVSTQIDFYTRPHARKKWIATQGKSLSRHARTHTHTLTQAHTHTRPFGDFFMPLNFSSRCCCCCWFFAYCQKPEELLLCVRVCVCVLVCVSCSWHDLHSRVRLLSSSRAALSLSLTATSCLGSNNRSRSRSNVSSRCCYCCCCSCCYCWPKLTRLSKQTRRRKHAEQIEPQFAKSIWPKWLSMIFSCHTRQPNWTCHKLNQINRISLLFVSRGRVCVR